MSIEKVRQIVLYCFIAWIACNLLSGIFHLAIGLISNILGLVTVVAVLYWVYLYFFQKKK